MLGNRFVVVSYCCAADARLALLLHVLALWIMDQISEVLVLVHVLLKYCSTGYAWLSFTFECACLGFGFWIKCAWLSLTFEYAWLSFAFECACLSLGFWIKSAWLSLAFEYAWLSFAFECAWFSFALESDTATSGLVWYNANADKPILVLCQCHSMSVSSNAT